MGVTRNFECWYDNGFAGGKWKLDRKKEHVTCELRFTEEAFELHNKKDFVRCPWTETQVKTEPSKGGNVICKFTLTGEKGGTSRIVLPYVSPAAFWAELWRVVPAMRPRLGHMNGRSSTARR